MRKAGSSKPELREHLLHGEVQLVTNGAGAGEKHCVDEEVPMPMTDLDKGLDDQEIAKAIEIYGLNEIPVAETPLYVIFVRQFTGFLPLLIEVAATMSLAVQDYVDFAIIVSILFINACLGFREEYHAKKALDELSSSLDSEVAVRRNGVITVLPTSQLVPGDIVLLVGGTIVPADVLWLRGDVMQIDTAALTGEPIPRKYPCAEHGKVILNGTTVVQGECYAQVVRTGTHTEMGQAQADVLRDKSVQVVSVFQEKIMRVVKLLISASLVMVIAVLLVEGIVYKGFQGNVRKTVLDALSIMIASIPVALPLVIQVNLALGAAFLAKQHHAIVTSIPALQDIASMSMLCSDKTGTLTTANMSIIPEQLFAATGFTKEQVILYAYLCSNPDKKDDPIDRAIVKAFRDTKHNQEQANSYQQNEIIGFNPTVKRVVVFVKQADGTTITIAKGLPAKIIHTAAGGEDDHELQWQVDSSASVLQTITATDASLSHSGYKTIGIAVCQGDARQLGDSAVWKFVGLVPMLDPPRHDTRATIESLQHANISVKMITGDHVNVGIETARLIGMGIDIRSGEEMRNSAPEDKKRLIWEADGFAAVLPSDKREAVLILRNEWGLVTGMTGDGVNDAPALSAAQVGIAVHGATDAAKNAADLILTEPGLSPIYGAVLESRRIFARMKAYVVYRVAASIILVLCLSIVLFATGCAVDSVLVIILALLNDISMIPVAYDNAQATSRPQLPHSKKIVIMSLFYGVTQAVATLIFIFAVNNASFLTAPISLSSNCSKATRGFIWYHLVLVTELMIFSVRAPSFFLFSKPSIYLLASVFVTCVGSAFIAVDGSSLYWSDVTWIVWFNMCTLVVVDVAKIYVRRLIHDSPGEVIDSDDLLVVEPVVKTVDQLILEKQQRYEVHNESILPAEDLQRIVHIRERNNDLIHLDDFFGELYGSSITDGFISKRYEKQFILPNTNLTEIPIRKKQRSWPIW